MKKITTFAGAALFAVITVSAFASATNRVLPQVYYQSSAITCSSAFAEICDEIGVANCPQELFSNEAGTTPLGLNQQVFADPGNGVTCQEPYHRP